MRARDWRRLPDGENEGGEKGQVPYRVPRVGQGVLWAGRPRPRYTRGRCGRAGRTAHSGSREKGDLPVGPCGQNMRWLRKLPWARGGQKSWRPCSLHVLSSDRPGLGHAPEDSAPCAYRERVGAGAPADSSGSAPSPGSSLHPNRKASKPAPGCPGTTSREAAVKLQVGVTPPTCPSVPRTAPSCSAPVLPGEASGVQRREPGTGRSRAGSLSWRKGSAPAMGPSRLFVLLRGPLCQTRLSCQPWGPWGGPVSAVARQGWRSRSEPSRALWEGTVEQEC